MTDQLTTAFASLVDTLVDTGNVPGTESLAKVAQSLANLFDADPDEAAILKIDDKSNNLKFVIPEKLAAIGSIPLSSATALAARTARERRGELVNNFSSSRRAS